MIEVSVQAPNARPPTRHTEGWQKATNLFVGGKRNSYAEDSRVVANW
ncbi:hypothetical protein [Magnetospirillum aberrantis]|uniref:Uncharacterized protein n=1 Tax=Magnetospirillum aberrantis SpK TaxID=908842 RepID=A0A7C9QRR4_9PROT|nr:hypothetical protein [Magnetospirillum aberrantis]NFV78882.1 hypothetical protein [Magnetospirillum aberrantis SpK]